MEVEVGSKQQQTSHGQKFFSFLLLLFVDGIVIDLQEAVGIASRFLSRFPTTSLTDVQNDNT